jgi:hypothetical protein
LLAALALSSASRLAENRFGSALVAVLVAVSGTHAALSLALTPYFPPEFSAPFAQLVLPSLADGAGFQNLLSSWLGVPTWLVATLSGATVLVTLAWATGRLIGRAWWRLAGIFLATAAILLSIYWWQGSSPSTEVELMRAQMLRRLGHEAAADQLETSLLSVSTSDLN